MSTEHETVMAKMASLQGTIDQRKKTLGSSTAALNANSPQPVSSSLTFVPSSSSRQQLSQPEVKPALSPNIPVITKTTWLSNTASTRQSMITPFDFRPPARSLTKLVLNRPNRAVQIKLPPTSASIPSIHVTPSPSDSPKQANSFTALPTNHSLPSSNLSSESISTTLPEQVTQLSVVDPLPSSSTSTDLANPAPSPPAISVLEPTSSSLSPLASSLSNKACTKSVLLSVQPTNPTNPNELVINGVSFVRDTQGKKLVRRTEPSPSPQPTTAPAPLSNVKGSLKKEEKKPTPIKASIGGMTYIRTKSGNLVELSALQKFQSQKLQQLKKARLLTTINAMKSKYQSNRSFSHWDSNKVYSKTTSISRPPLIKKNKQCQFFAKTGACRNGLTCVYQHDPLQVAICPRFLRRRCPHSASSCPLSHVPNAHNMEHCSHFPRCTKTDCPYPHVQATTSQICQEFADLGWCPKGAQCTERHVRECPEFSTKGTCSNVGCRLRHIINRNSNDNEDNQPAELGQSDEDGVGLFFTDLTGTDLGVKRKANESTSNSRVSQKSHHGPSKGISHNSDLPFKRIKYDAMADNDDYVMFISSDEEEASVQSERTEADDEPSSSVDSEELERVSLDRLPQNSLAHPSLDPHFEGLTNSHNHVLCHPPVQTRMRSHLGSEEIEEGEIFEEDDFGDDDVITNGKEPVVDPFFDDSSSDEDEIIARQLVGDRLRSLAI